MKKLRNYALIAIVAIVGVSLGANLVGTVAYKAAEYEIDEQIKKDREAEWSNTKSTILATCAKDIKAKYDPADQDKDGSLYYRFTCGKFDFSFSYRPKPDFNRPQYFTSWSENNTEELNIVASYEDKTFYKELISLWKKTSDAEGYAIAQRLEAQEQIKKDLNEKQYAIFEVHALILGKRDKNMMRSYKDPFYKTSNLERHLDRKNRRAQYDKEVASYHSLSTDVFYPVLARMHKDMEKMFTHKYDGHRSLATK